MRGKGLDRFDDVIPDRITPAYAGKRVEKAAVKRGIEDHPRLCGEKCYVGLTFEIIIGSPPPMRGKVIG